MSIFVQIVSYKGFGLLETVLDCIATAKNKDSLFFGIVLQQDEDVPEELSGPNFRTFKFPLGESVAHGYAYKRAQQMYSGQDYVLQVDSGCKFAEGWDEELVSSLNRLGDRAIITNIPGKLGPNGEKESTVPYKPQIYQFIDEAPLAWPAPMKNISQIIKGRYISEKFFFAKGTHCTECPYDSDMYGTESEAFINLLSFTKGYEFHHHNKPLVWRDYGKRPSAWENDGGWWLKQNKSREKFARMIKQKTGLGEVRTLRDYELYSGIDFEKRRIQKDTASGAAEVPNRYENESQWESGYMKDYSLTVSWNSDDIERCDDYDYWYFSIEDDSGATLTRQDIRKDRESAILEFKTNYKKVWFKAPADKVPKTVCIWPASKSKGWLRKSKFALQ